MTMFVEMTCGTTSLWAPYWHLPSRRRLQQRRGDVVVSSDGNRRRGIGLLVATGGGGDATASTRNTPVVSRAGWTRQGLAKLVVAAASRVSVGSPLPSVEYRFTTGR